MASFFDKLFNRRKTKETSPQKEKPIKQDMSFLRVDPFYRTPQQQAQFNEWYAQQRKKRFAQIDATYDLNTLEGIESIPKSADVDISLGDEFYTPVSYRLERKATEHKKAGNFDLAIACLKKANELTLASKGQANQEALKRITEYLKLQGKFDAAREAQKEYSKEASAEKSQIRNTNINLLLDSMKLLDTHLVATSYTRYCCPECAKYRCRVFSATKEDTRYPYLPKFLIENPTHCGISLYAFDEKLHELSDYNFKPVADPISFSNRPFVDDRTPEEIEYYESHRSEEERAETDRCNYDWLREHMPELAPKSFGAYRRMRNQNTANWQKIYKAMLEKNKDLTQ